MEVERVRVIDAHPPREVVPAYRDVSAAVSDAARYLNEASGYAAQQEQGALADARQFRDNAATTAHQLESQATGEKAAFLLRQEAHATHPDLTEFRILWNTIATSYAARSKVILDPRAAGRRTLWLADPARFGAVMNPGELGIPAIPDGADFPMD
jgi:regulator of protease activity HflC (stomatin/prohibitin superfamily)